MLETRANHAVFSKSKKKNLHFSQREKENFLEKIRTLMRIPVDVIATLRAALLIKSPTAD